MFPFTILVRRKRKGATNLLATATATATATARAKMPPDVEKESAKMPDLKKSSKSNNKNAKAEILQNFEEHEMSEENSSSSSAHTLVEDEKVKVQEKVKFHNKLGGILA